ncbi:hypothetical protein, partial [Nocardia caishijiensis]|uniref:hypothetical protein n=1 Tax=Nocardia caishijiensis TaxID=184756 RepID=UPI001F16CE8C
VDTRGSVAAGAARLAPIILACSRHLLRVLLLPLLLLLAGHLLGHLFRRFLRLLSHLHTVLSEG